MSAPGEEASQRLARLNELSRNPHPRCTGPRWLPTSPVGLATMALLAVGVVVGFVSMDRLGVAVSSCPSMPTSAICASPMVAYLVILPAGAMVLGLVVSVLGGRVLAKRDRQPFPRRSPAGRVPAGHRGRVPDRRHGLSELPDVLPPVGAPFRVLFCGINPGLTSAATGHHYAGPGNRFWPALHAAGFTPTLLRPAQQDQLAALGLGLTNLVARSSTRADELSRDELTVGAERLRLLLAERAPRWLAVAGVTAYRTAFGARRAVIGCQSGRIGTTGSGCCPTRAGSTRGGPGPRSPRSSPGCAPRRASTTGLDR